MALQVRRGTNAERLGITPAEGELIYVTDTKQLYIGDGTTAGGTTTTAGTIDSVLADTTPQLGGTLDLNGHDINGVGNISITGTITATGNINLGDGAGNDIITVGGEVSGSLVPTGDIAFNLGSTSKKWKEAWISQLNVDNQITAQRIEADIIASDSTIVFNATTGAVAAAQLVGTATINVVGNVTGNVVGNTTGYHSGDMTGSVFADNSVQVVDGLNGNVNATVLSTDTILTNSILDLELASGAAGTVTSRIYSNDDDSILSLVRRSTSDISGTNLTYGRVSFVREDIGGVVVTSMISGARDYLTLFSDTAGNTSDPSKYIVVNNGSVSIGAGVTPTATLDVAGAIKPGVYADTTARDAAIPTPVAGMIIFNTTGTKFQGYTGSAWVDLN